MHHNNIEGTKRGAFSNLSAGQNRRPFAMGVAAVVGIETSM
jgi:hypothetical protein